MANEVKINRDQNRQSGSSGIECTDRVNANPPPTHKTRTQGGREKGVTERVSEVYS